MTEEDQKVFEELGEFIVHMAMEFINKEKGQIA